MKLSSKYFTSLSLLFALALAGCSDSGSVSNTDDNQNVVAESIVIAESEDTNTSDPVDAIDTVRADVSTELAYSNGYTVVSALRQSPTMEDQLITYTLDTAENIITSDRFGSFFLYDEQGRVTQRNSPSSNGINGDLFFYNSDGTISSQTDDYDFRDSITGFEYERGKLVRRTFTTTKQDGGELLVDDQATYNYMDDKLVSMQLQRSDPEQEVVSWEYLLTENGRISEANFMLSLNPSNDSRYVFSYDEHGNVDSYEIYKGNGELTEKWTFSYIENVEPIPNLVSHAIGTDRSFTLRVP